MRDLNVERKLREEAERRELLSRSTIDNLRAENENLQQAKDSDDSIIRRRDRMIEDLRLKLEAEKNARERADEAAGRAVFEKDEAVRRAEREVMEAREKEGHSTVHAQAAADSLRRQRDRNDLLERQMISQANAQAEKSKARDVVQEQLQHHLNHQDKTVQELRAKTGHYTKSVEAFLIAQAEAARERFRQDARVTQAAESILGEVGQYIRLAKLQLERGTSGDQSPVSPASPATPDDDGSPEDPVEVEAKTQLP